MKIGNNNGSWGFSWKYGIKMESFELGKQLTGAKRENEKTGNFV
jgi:hypothetical protein